MFTVLYKLLDVFGIDHPYLLIILPRLLQGIFSAGQDVALFLLSWKLFDHQSAYWTLFCHLTSWFTFYTATRTLTNTMESICTTFGLLFYPWPSSLSREPGNARLCVLFSAVSVVMRPTAAIIWFPLYLWHLMRTNVKSKMIFTIYAPIGLAVLLVSMVIDYTFYGKLVFVQYNFLEFNVLHDMGEFYGSHPWHWYITQGLPAILGPHLPLVVLGGRGDARRLLPLVLLVLWVVLSYSFLSHKEFRFILPVLPICMLFCGSFLSKCKQTTKHLLVTYLIVLNLPLALYTGLWHQRGTIDVMRFLQTELSSKSAPEDSYCLFLMPCHSTPFYSHLHINAKLRFLMCEPNLEEIPGYIDESSVFYQNPEEWLMINDVKRDYSDYVIMFDVLTEKVQSFLKSGRYIKIAEFFHTHFPDGRVGGHVVVFHQTDQSDIR
ncbi:putative GPI mannosyltransferase 3 [Apostichopus japonicus]|uniref:Mannosyltransferase n=1 Tax=Stichopus japonicus TaxID=307972 RepID=A0A2G8KVR6_STIJA|nr:putative GPI mannosyltransferase 3 [Apostichopus japonicus]